MEGEDGSQSQSHSGSVQITRNSTECELGGFVFQFTECSLALKKKNIETTTKNLYKYRMYNLGKKKKKDFQKRSSLRVEW